MEERAWESPRPVLFWKRSIDRVVIPPSVTRRCTRWGPCFGTEAKNRNGDIYLQSRKANSACRLLRSLNRTRDPKRLESRLGPYARETGTSSRGKKSLYRARAIRT